MRVALGLGLMGWTGAKVVEGQWKDKEPVVLSQFCFQSGKGSISLEAQANRPDQRLVLLETVNFNEINAFFQKDCARIAEESYFWTELTEHKYFNYLEIKSEKQDFCLTTAAISCKEGVDLTYYTEYLNDEGEKSELALSLEDQGLPFLFLLGLLLYLPVLFLYSILISDSESLEIHPELLLFTKISYLSLLIHIILCGVYYWTYLFTGNSMVFIRNIAVYSHFIHELAVLALLSLHATGYFMRKNRAALEVKVVLLLYAVIMVYFAVKKTWESPDLVDFEWIYGGKTSLFLRLTLGMCQILWAGQGFIHRKDDQRDLFGLLSYGGLLWTLSTPGLLWITSLMMPFRAKYYQIFGQLAVNIGFGAFFLAFLHRDSALVLFSSEEATKALKKSSV